MLQFHGSGEDVILLLSKWMPSLILEWNTYLATIILNLNFGLIPHTKFQFNSDILFRRKNFKMASITPIVDITRVLINKNIQGKIVDIFLPIIFSICFVCSEELSH